MSVTLNVTGQSSDGRIESKSSNRTYARDGLGTFAVDTTLSAYQIGRLYASWRTPKEYLYWEGFWSFDTSTIPTDATIDSVTLTGYFQTNNPAVYWFYPVLYGPSLTSDDWMDSTELNNVSKVGEMDVSTLPTTSTFMQGTVSNTPEMLTNGINKGGVTQFVIITSNWFQEDNSDSNFSIKFSEAGVEAPQLSVTYSTAPQGFSHLDSEGSGLRAETAGSGNHLVTDASGYRRVTGTEGPGSLILGANGQIITKS